MILLWAQVLLSAGIMPEDVQPAIQKHCTISQYWPTPSEIVKLVKKARQERYYELGMHLALPPHEMTPEEAEENRKGIIELREILKREKPYLFAPIEPHEIPKPRPEYREPTQEEREETERLRQEQLGRLRLEDRTA